MEVLWFIPTHSDGRYLSTSIGGRATNHDYLKQIAQAIILSGYPHLEEAYRVAELLFPKLPLNHLPEVNQQTMFSPFWEIIVLHPAVL